MLNNIKNFLNEQKEKITKIALITIAVIILLIIFSIQVQSYIKISKAKQEMLQEERAKNEYTLKLINWVQEFNKKIPEFETKIRILKLKNRCYNDQIERKKNNKVIEINFCEKKENYEKYSEKNNKEEPQDVAFSFISKVEAIESDEFMPELPKPKGQPKKADFSILWTNEHKAQFAYDYALQKWFSHNQALYLVAQLHQENWTWDEKRKWDEWCSLGIIQWNQCSRWKIPAKDRKWQIKIFVNEIKTKFEICKNFRQAQVAWNNPSVLNSWSYKTRYFYKTEEIYNNLF